jgi:hypothetical protein
MAAKKGERSPRNRTATPARVASMASAAWIGFRRVTITTPAATTTRPTSRMRAEAAEADTVLSSL